MQISAENREGEGVISNIAIEALHEILESDELDKVLDDCEKRPSCLYGDSIDNSNPPDYDLKSNQG